MNKSTSPHFLNPNISFTAGQNGVYYLQSNTLLGRAPTSVITYLEKWKEERSDTIFLAERNKSQPGQWVSVTYNEFYQKACRLAANLEPFGLSKDRPLMIISGNSIGHALLTMACYFRAVPVVPVFPSYSLLSNSYEKLGYIQELTGAGVVYAENSDVFTAPIQAIYNKGLQVISNDDTASGNNHYLLKDLLSRPPTQPFSCHDVCSDDIAKIMFTSGSTDMPKGVINTHYMLTTNQESMATVWPFIQKAGHLFLDWLPWHHTFGENHNFNMVLRNGTTLYIEDGKPTPDGIGSTINNLQSVSPTLSFNVAIGYELLCSELEKNPEAAHRFFKNYNSSFLPLPPFLNQSGHDSKRLSKNTPKNPFLLPAAGDKPKPHRQAHRCISTIKFKIILGYPFLALN